MRRSNLYRVHRGRGGPSRVGGFTLTELTVVLVLIAGLSAVILSRTDVLQTSGKVEEEAEAVESIRVAIQKAYSGENTYNGLNNAAIYDSVPDIVHGASEPNLANDWSGTGYSVSPTSGGDQYKIESKQVPEQPCKELADRFLNSFSTIKINGTTVNNPGDTASACTGSSNTIAFIGR